MKTINLLFTTILSSLFAADAAAQCSVFCHNADLSNISDMRGLSLNDVHRNMSMHMRTSAATASRIIAQADLNNNGASFVYTDSIKLSYVGTHGGDLNHLGLQLKFDSGYVYAYNSGTSSWDLNLYQFQTFDASDRQIATVSQTWHSSTSTYVNSAENLYNWAGANLQFYVYQQWDSASSAWVNRDKYLYSYDGADNIISEVHQVWNTATSAWDNDYQYNYTYNVNNKVTMEADQTWSAGAWLNQTQTTYTYDATNNFVLTEIYHSWNSGTSSWDVTGKKVNTYDASNNKLTALIQEWTAGTWQNYSLSTYSSFVTQLPQTEIYQMWNTTTLGFDNATKYTYTYNDANQLTNQVSQTWNIGGFWQNSTADRESRFYYEPYTTGVNNLANNENSLILYPVPATDRIHIDLQWGQIQPFTVWIYNVQGIIIDKWEVPATASYYDDVPLNLPTGNYFMRFSGVTWNIVQQFLVAR